MALTWTWSIEWDIEDWRGNAACRDTDPDLFFPVGSTGPAVEQIISAKAVCATCDARDSCLEFAVGHEPGVRHLGRDDRRGKAQAP